MNSINKSLIVATIVGAVGTGVLFTGSVANAESETTGSDPMSSLIEKLSSTFNLDKDKVQQVFDDQRTEMEAKREEEVAERLNALVSEGKITSAQKTAIEEKIATMKSERESNKDTMKDMTEDERKAAMEEKRADLEAWAKDQGLDLSDLRGILGGPGGHKGPRP